MAEQTATRTAHSPGPWDLEFRGWFTWYVRDADGHLVADVQAALATEARYSEPNARLIAAAPELLEALQAVLTKFHAVFDSEVEVRRQAVAAIQKATGASS